MAQEVAGRAGTRTGGAEDGAGIARLVAKRIRSLAIGQQIEERGARCVLWLDEAGRKVPKRINGLPADTTKASTWYTLDECEKALGKVAATGIGLVLAAERDAAVGWPPIVGIDLDGCRNPETGEIKPWALEIIRAFASYAEVSPSGSGVKIYCFADPVPPLAANKLVIHPANGTGKAQQIEVYVTARYFALTGEHLDFTPDELTDATEAFERLVGRIARKGGAKVGKANGSARSDGAAPSEATMRLLVNNPRLAKLWRGEKSKEEGDTSASGKDMSLACALGRAGVADDEIACVLTRYAHGQLGGGALKNKAAERRLGQLLQFAREARSAEGERAEAVARADIRLRPEHWNRMLGECADILRPVLYMRGTVPVMLARAVETGGRKAEDRDGAAVDINGVRHRPGSLLFMEAVHGRVSWYLDEHATFWRYVRREKE